MDTVYDRIFTTKTDNGFFQLLRHKKTKNWAMLIVSNSVRMIKFKKYIESYTLQSGTHTFLYITVEDKKRETHSMWAADNESLQKIKEALESHAL